MTANANIALPLTLVLIGGIPQKSFALPMKRMSAGGGRILSSSTPSSPEKLRGKKIGAKSVPEREAAFYSVKRYALATRKLDSGRSGT